MTKLHKCKYKQIERKQLYWTVDPYAGIKIELSRNVRLLPIRREKHCVTPQIMPLLD